MQREFYDYLRCGILAHGFLRLGCDTCHHELLVPFSCKRETFMRFKEIVEMMERKEHLRDDGLAEIVRKVYSMNPASKGRARLRPLDEVLARILRGHTSDIPSSG